MLFREGLETLILVLSPPLSLSHTHTQRVLARMLLPTRAPAVEACARAGSWYGASTRWLAKAYPDATIFAVDLWSDDFILDAQRDHYATMGLIRDTKHTHRALRFFSSFFSPESISLRKPDANRGESSLRCESSRVVSPQATRSWCACCGIIR